jgi:hypothetical protein
MSKNDIEELERGLAFAEEGRRRWREKALVARKERDELKRRLDAVAARLEPGEHDFWCDNCQKTVPAHCETDYPLSHWCDHCDREVFEFDYEDAAEDAKAIAEGRQP